MKWIKINGRRFNFDHIRDFIKARRGNSFFIDLIDSNGKKIPILCDSEEVADRLARNIDSVLKMITVND